MAIFGVTEFGTDVFGLSLPPAYLVEPMVAASVDYGSILVQWKQPTSGVMFRYRLLSNRYGFPVNENDGTIIYDSTTYPGSSYLDTQVIPGTYHYYAFYVLVDVGDNIWIRSGLAACLSTDDFGQAQFMLDHMPESFKTNMQNGGELDSDSQGNIFLYMFLNVLGWSADYLKTQYDFLLGHLNDAFSIPVNDLWQLASELGLNFSSAMPAYTVRKAAANWGHVSQSRGTLSGINQEIELRTGWSADLQNGINILLEDDQSQFLAPIMLDYTPERCFHLNECCHVWVNNPFEPWFYGWPFKIGGWRGDGYWYQCLTEGLQGVMPPQDGSSNGNWRCVSNQDDFLQTLIRQGTSAPSTWEVLDSTAANGLPPAQNALTQAIGVPYPNPPGSHYQAWNALRCYNRGGTARTLWCRSVARRTSDLGQCPDPGFESGFAIPEVAPVEFHTKTWKPKQWPTVYDWDGNDTGAMWTTNTGLCTLNRTQSNTHSGNWCMTVNTNITAEVAAQIPDPSFGVGVSEWTANNCAIEQADNTSHSTGWSMQISPQAVPNPYVTSVAIPSFAGEVATLQVYLNPLSNGTPSMQLGMEYFDGHGNSLGTTLGTASAVVANTWTSYTATGTAPAGTETKSAIIQYNGTPTTGNTVYADDVLWTNTVSGTPVITVQSPWVTCPPGTPLTGSFWARCAGTPSVQAQLIYMDQNGLEISVTNGSASALTSNTWGQRTCSDTSPANCAYVALQYHCATPPALMLCDDIVVSLTQSLNSKWPPDPRIAVADGIPIPWVRDSQDWNSSIRYATGSIVLFRGQPFEALQASAGVPPPLNNVANTCWTPLSPDRRIRLLESTQMSQDLSQGSNLTSEIIPFMEWYDQQGNYIARVFSRNPNVGGAVARPNNMAFDSFTVQTLLGSSGTSATAITLSNWTADYYANVSTAGAPTFSRVDPSLNFTWNGTSPAPGIPDSGWSAIWTNSFTVPVTATYQFQLQAGQGGTVLKVNGTTVINNWRTMSAGNLTANVPLTAGANVSVEVNYVNQAVPPAGLSYTGNIIDPPFTGSYSTGNYPLLPGGFVTGEIDFGHVDRTVLLTVAFLDFFFHPIATWDVEASTGLSSLLDFGFESDPAPEGTCYVTVNITGAGAPPTVFGTSFVRVATPQAGTNSDSINFGTISQPSTISGTIVTSPNLNGRTTDDGQSQWVTTAGSWIVDQFVEGAIHPAVPGTRSVSYLTGPADTDLGVTFRSAADSGNAHGIIFRRSDDNNYWRASATKLKKKVAGVMTTVATYSTPCSANDRLAVSLLGSAITVYRNNVQVATATDTFNQTATEHGVIYEAA